MVFALSANECMRRSHVIAQQYLKKSSKFMLCLRDITNLAEILKGHN